MKTTVPVLVNRIFSGLFLLFQVPGSRAPERAYGELDKVHKKILEIRAQSREDFDPEEMKIALAEQINALMNLPPLDPGPSVDECCELARVNRCDVIVGEDFAVISKPLLSFALCLEIQRNQVTIKVYEPKTQSNYLEVCYWQPVDCPMLVCKPYLHPLANNWSAPLNIRLGLKKIDREYGCDAILNQSFSWPLKD